MKTRKIIIDVTTFFCYLLLPQRFDQRFHGRVYPVEMRTVLRLILPALQHETVNLFGRALRSRHPVPYNRRRKKNRLLSMDLDTGRSIRRK